MPSAEQIKQRIEAAILGPAPRSRPDRRRRSLSATVTAEASPDAAASKRRLVYDVFGAEIGGPIHALTLKTSPPRPRP
jgi:hypothetical protein